MKMTIYGIAEPCPEPGLQPLLAEAALPRQFGNSPVAGKIGKQHLVGGVDPASVAVGRRHDLSRLGEATDRGVDDVEAACLHRKIVFV